MKGSGKGDVEIEVGLPSREHGRAVWLNCSRDAKHNVMREVKGGRVYKIVFPSTIFCFNSIISSLEIV